MISASEKSDPELFLQFGHSDWVLSVAFSPDGSQLASDYCYDTEMKRALEKHGAGEARVIPIIVRPVDWEGASFGKLQALPKNAEPVTRWPDRDEAWVDVARGIRKAVEELRQGQAQ